MPNPGIQTYASVDDGFIYHLPLGIHKSTESQCLQRFINTHGLQAGTELYKLRREISVFLSKQSTFEILLVQVKLMIEACIALKFDDGQFCEMSRKIIVALNSQLDMLMHRFGLSEFFPKIRDCVKERIQVNNSVVWYAKEIDLIYVFCNK